MDKVMDDGTMTPQEARTNVIAGLCAAHHGLYQASNNIYPFTEDFRYRLERMLISNAEILVRFLESQP
jgi:hypothetical protein